MSMSDEMKQKWDELMESIHQVFEENRQLLEQLAAAKHDLSLLSSVVVESKAKNAKLTKLARWMYQVMDESCAVHYPYEPAPVSMQSLMRAEKELQALGIEVDE